MRRVQVLIQHIASEEAAPDAHAEQASAEAAVPDAKALARENAQRFMAVGMEYVQSVQNLREHGTIPTMTAFEFSALQRRFQTREAPNSRNLQLMLDQYTEQQDGSLGGRTDIAGPWAVAGSPEQQTALLRECFVANQQGRNVQLWAQWATEFGDEGLARCLSRASPPRCTRGLMM